MSRQLITRNLSILSAANSNITSPAIYVGDYEFLSLSWSSSASNGSRLTVVGSNDEGFRSALGTPSQTVNAGGWSQVTAITSAGIYSLTAGMRWITVFRDGISAASMMTVTLEMKT